MRGHGSLFVEKEDGKRLSLVPNVGTDGGPCESQTPTPFPLNFSPNGEMNMPKSYVPVIELNFNV